MVQISQHLNEIGPNNQHAERLYVIPAVGKSGGCYILEGMGGKDAYDLNFRFLECY